MDIPRMYGKQPKKKLDGRENFEENGTIHGFPHLAGIIK